MGIKRETLGLDMLSLQCPHILWFFIKIWSSVNMSLLELESFSGSLIHSSPLAKGENTVCVSHFGMFLKL